jgi:hypothetical protein
MESKINTSAIVTALQIGASITINSVSETVNVLTFSSDFAESILDSPSSFYASIFRPTLASGDTAEALVNATSQPPRIIAYNQTGSPVAGIPAYSIVVQPWTNGYAAAIGDVVIFEPATNPIANQNYLVGVCATVSSSLIQGETCFRGALRDIYRLKNRVDGLANTDLSTLLSDDFSINSGGVLCGNGSLSIGYTAGTARYKGQNFSFLAGSIGSLTGKTCYRAIVNQDGTNSVQAENATGGSIDATYSPSGGSSLPTASSPIWTALGTASTETVTNSALNLAVSSNYRVYDRAGTAGPPASGTTLDAIVLWVSGSNASRIEIDDGTSRDSVIVNQSSITLESTGQTFALDCTQWTWIRLTLKNDIANVYVNGGSDPVLSSSNALATITNRFRFGNWLGYSGATPQNATGEAKFAYVRTIGSGELIPAFPTLTGAVLGSAITSASGQTQTVGVQTSSKDVELGVRREGRLIGESDLTEKNIQFNKNISAPNNLLPLYALPTNYHDVSIEYLTTATVRIKSGSRCRSTDDTKDIIFASDYTIDMSNATPTSTTGGRSVAEAADTWYYLYVGLDSSGLPLAWLDTANLAGGGSPTNPAAYSSGRRQLKFAARNNASSNIEQFDYFSCLDLIIYTNSSVGGAGNNNLVNGGAPGTTWTNITPTSVFPPVSKLAYLQANTFQNTASNSNLQFRKSATETTLNNSIDSRNAQTKESVWFQVLQSNQTFQYSYQGGSDTTAGRAGVSSLGFVITEIK